MDNEYFYSVHECPTNVFDNMIFSTRTRAYFLGITILELNSGSMCFLSLADQKISKNGNFTETHTETLNNTYNNHCF